MKLQSINPHDQSVVGEVEISTAEDVVLAVSRARGAFSGWRHTPIEERIAYIKKYRQKIAEHKEEIARLTTLEMGKPLKQSLEDVDFELGFLDYYVTKGAENLADEPVFEEKNEYYRAVFEPYGVVAAIAPWNFPLSMANSGIIPALV
ncbi:MAG: aldehyde dehydrogenase family protein, partial [Candidatus Colwellbacteria bacterium]|nr:aldehyde dehydrogenase family protein [Candidatus Colwellbacteria bacterium]